MKTVLLMTMALIALAAPATAMAASDATPGKLVATSGSHSSATGRAICSTVWAQYQRNGLTGGRLWDYRETINYCRAGGLIQSHNITRTGHGSLTWDWEGTNSTDHWGGNGKTRVGGSGQGHFQSNIRAPFVTENNYPWVSITVYGDGHWTHNQTCGC
jgi:hypothetical protein